MARNPNKVRCTAKSKRTGEQCKAWAKPGYNVCHYHGASKGVPGNQHNKTHGFFAKIFPDDDETRGIIAEIEVKSPIEILWDQIVIQYTAIARAQKIMFVQDKDDRTEVLKRERSGKNPETEWELQHAWDKQANFLAQKVLCDCTDLDREIAQLCLDLELLSQSGRQAIHDNARASADQTEFADKHRSLVAKYEESSPRLAELEADRNRRREQGKILKSFIKEIETRELVLEEFDEKLWLAVIDHVTILANGRLVFTFMDGTSVE